MEGSFTHDDKHWMFDLLPGLVPGGVCDIDHCSLTVCVHCGQKQS